MAIPKAGDRRRAPRREEEVRLHYAEFGLLAAALAVADAIERTGPTVAVDLDRLAALESAAATYRQAEADAFAARTTQAVPG